MQRAHHDSFLLSPYSLKAVLHLWTAWYHWTVPECLLWVTKLTLPICWTSIPSGAVPTQFPSRDLPSTSPPPSASRQRAPGRVLLPASLGPLSHSHCLTSASWTCSPFLRWQKGGRCTLFAPNRCIGVCTWDRDPSSHHLCCSSAWITYYCVNWKYMPR